MGCLEILGLAFSKELFLEIQEACSSSFTTSGKKDGDWGKQINK
jgi:hypothetical protein